eukprot:4019592-Pyramimonas_sp.AAC.1
MGVDAFTPLDFERLPKTGLTEMTLLLEAAEATLTWPTQTLLIIDRLTPKKSNGERAIGLASMLGRVWSMIRESEVQTWTFAQATFWDAAITGNSCLQEAFLDPSMRE